MSEKYSKFPLKDRGNVGNIVILDFYLKKLDALSLIKKIKLEYPIVKTIVLTKVETTFLLLQIIEAGADSIITKAHDHPIVNIIRLVSQGGNFLQLSLGFAVVKAALERQIIFTFNKK